MLALLAAATAPENLSTFSPASPAAEWTRELFVLVAAITGGILLLVEGILFYALIRCRRRTGPADAEPPQVYGSKPIEIAWTLAPLIVVFVLVLLVGRVLWEVRPDPVAASAGVQPLHVTVIGHQWWWEYRYDSYDGRDLGGIVTANELHIPVSPPNGVQRPVYLNLQSADVCHSFWIPRLGGKTDLLPGRANTMWLQANEPGLYLGQCAEYCGTQHANMLLRVVVESPEDFEKYLAAEAKPAADPTDKVALANKEAFRSQSCVNCHTVRDKQDTRANGTFGPDLTHLMARKTIAAGMIPNTPENLKKWVFSPESVKPGCLMAGFDLGEKDMKAVIDYLTTLK
ncbi:cytochrome c oxidase subunit ii : Cytochrome c oxidase subunit 2 OS=Granulicella mallensis (strain ATCC BAA-1857 / DSM 23137 / MP5ACTX8) GN=AciX8_2886 PE=3 SV=1: COX2_TM: COX2: Cytochrom_C [Gemmataceae bacterium]|nr:cytochrome c oxidase subunit ii : Cytochrome c oxidase subunit 2 OS=Granulicella mallensis (strain ATCC BAA-1857 / DSM 23137 / MP5ACTX8) GN=AciX8_2886 PE=3 SV=1: COX2_TM: COX2: Cytochrom_C [Gemmataceae bacterium]VTT97037.1 cytochrome c oxidase subunit ii : Cytochrome c oxidase subunit 2 OS=Granulicella mallensis (strain ATCC BAA-1857 / DSM 23137 / MP5ACTX8) GN=AciX8_2886 PE=3 SV=1: COX2_TM: COX2: Cytochrom_C [Gemmataceae bacterium]